MMAAAQRSEGSVAALRDHWPDGTGETRVRTGEALQSGAEILIVDCRSTQAVGEISSFKVINRIGPLAK